MSLKIDFAVIDVVATSAQVTDVHERFARLLGLSDATMSEIKHKRRHGKLYDIVCDIIKVWCEQKASEATAEALIAVLKHMKFKDTADSVRKLVESASSANTGTPSALQQMDPVVVEVAEKLATHADLTKVAVELHVPMPIIDQSTTNWPRDIVQAAIEVLKYWNKNFEGQMFERIAELRRVLKKCGRNDIVSDVLDKYQ